MDMASRLGLVVLNTGSTSTFRRPGCRETIIDVSFALERLAAHVRDWQNEPVEEAPRSCTRRWNVDKLDTKKLSQALECGQLTLVEIPDGVPASERAQLVVGAIMHLNQRACKEAVPIKTVGRRCPAYWLLRTGIPEGCSLVGYADNVAVTIIARNVEIAQTRLDQVMCRVRHWMGDHGLELADAKTEIALLTKKRISNIQEWKIGDTTVRGSIRDRLATGTGRDTGRGSEGIDGKPSGTLAVYVQHLPPGGNILFLLKRGETGAGRQGTGIPEECSLVGYADDVAVTIIARNVEIAQTRLDQVMCRVRHWMGDHGLELADAKTEIALLTKKRISNIQEWKIGDTTVHSRAAIKYLGMTLDTKLTFGEHIRKAADVYGRGNNDSQQGDGQYWRFSPRIF
ncbi:hypothetical protein TSAR_016013 [Trichomalopsis sarcophagae]|uniref:Uncharacterized protein n=1 Tax=Trichomalopsis sarcophagae TaxID=543379 RepID=A0A232ENN9_9HYME|nr:hypothetical protein TSAR_016013 [Trichomalopsis sarcophagae]